MEIDLHDLTVNDAIKTFIEKYNRLYKQGYRGTVEVIHGYGSSGKGGKIKKAFKKFAEEHKKFFKVEYNTNSGITLIKPISKIPEIRNILENEILEFCKDTPKSAKKIEGEFFKKYETEQIKSAIKSLVKKDELKEILKKRDRVYLKN